MSNCNSICRNYRTEKGYLCDKEESTNLGGKKWCKINTNDVNNYGLHLPDPYSKTGLLGKYYWDYIKEKGKQKICINDGKTDYYSCPLINNYNYYLGVLATLFLTPTIAGGSFIYSLGGEHLKQTIQLSTATNKQLLIFLIGKLRELAQKELVNNGISTQDELSNVIQQLKDSVNEIDENDTKAYGKYVKNIFSEASKIIKDNEKNQSELGPTSVMDFFINYIPDEYALEVLKGGNFASVDNGKLYKITQEILKGFVRMSSHPSDGSQYGYTTMFVDSYLHLLCGIVIKDGTPSVSWCQFEGAPMPPGLTTLEVFKNIYDGKNLNKEFLQQYVDHFVDSGYYFAYSKIPSLVMNELKNIVSKLPENIQSKLPEIPETKPFNLALGRSPHTDTNPIYLLPFDLQEVNSMPIEPPTTINYLKNSFTYALGIHSDLFSNTTQNNNDTISSEEYQRTKQFQNYKQLGFVNNTNMYLPNAMPAMPVSQPPMLGMGGKYKKNTKKNKTKKYKTKKYKTKIYRIRRSIQNIKGKKSHKNRK
jgi:hypothetical protein